MCLDPITLILGAAAASAVSSPKTPAMATPGAALQQQATAAQAPPTSESVGGNDAEQVLNRLRQRRMGAMGAADTNVTGGVVGQAPTSTMTGGVRTPNTPMAQQGAGYKPDKKNVGE